MRALGLAKLLAGSLRCTRLRRRALARPEVVPGTRTAEQGQASLMIGMMILTFVLFFAFVVNTGMLVNAKINLQNAADLAAYAGASVQGRQLNTVSFLNYEMRRQYKKFLFRYYVMGNLAQDSHPGTQGPRQWRPSNASAVDYQVPAVCIIFNARDNFCHINPTSGLRGIQIPPETLLDQINNTVRAQLKAIERLRKTNCAGIGVTNIQLLLFWLFNTDPRFEYLTVQDADLLRLVRGAADGLGLVPREILLLQRIKTMAKMINTPPEKINLEKAQAYQDSGRAEVERQVAAFMSVHETLGQNVFDPNSVTLDEIGPSDAKPYFDFQPIQAKFDAWAVDFRVESPLGSGNYLSPKAALALDSDPAAASCKPVLAPISLQGQGVPLGIRKDPSKLTYYAVRLEAEAKTMFSPFGDMRLRAYSAAAPYGSRVGPPATDEEFLRKGVEPNSGVPKAVNAINLQKNIPNLRVSADDDIQNLGWNNGALIAAMYGQLGNRFADTITSDDIQRGYQAAMVPNPAETGLYNMLPTNDWADSTIKFFDTRLEYAVWAPLFSEGQQGAVDELKQTIDEVMAPPPFATGDDNGRGDQLRAFYKEALGRYIDKIRTGQGEAGEGMNVLRLPDPFKGRPLAAGSQPADLIGLPEKFMIRTPQGAKTSWNKEDDTNGRTGYSVKFISFDSLLGKKIPTGISHPRFPAAEVPATNLPNLDATAAGDLDTTVFKH